MKKIDHQIIYNKVVSSVTEYAICWHIKLKNGEEIGFTDHDNDIKTDKFEYLSKALIRYNAIQKSVDMLKDFNEISGVIEHDLIKEKDILKGKFDNALLSIYLVNYKDLKQPEYLLKQGYISSIKCSNNQLYADISPITEKLNSNITKSFSPYCRAKFCDEKCKLDKNVHTRIGKIHKIINKNSFLMKIETKIITTMILAQSNSCLVKIRTLL